MAGEEAFRLVISERQQHVIVPHDVRVLTALIIQEMELLQ